MSKSRGPVRRLFGALGRGLDLLRRIISNLLFVAVLVVIVVVLRGDAGPKVQPGSALVVAIHGALVEEYEGDAVQRALDNLAGAPPRDTRVRDVVRAVDGAAGDERIEYLVLDVTRMGGGQLGKLQEIGAALARFRESGKPIVAYADSYHQSSWYLAALADETWLSPMGTVRISGYEVFPYYLAELLDNLDLDVHIFRAGENKAAVEPYLRDDMSEQTRELTRAWLQELWGEFLAETAAARELSPEAIQQYADRFADVLEAHAGDGAAAALEQGLVSEILTRDQVRARMIDALGENGNGSYPHIGHRNYVTVLNRERPLVADRPRVGVITLSGMILDGARVPAGAVAADRVVQRIREAREDDSIHALVVRVDSPGGSAFGSELIRRELEVTREAGKPVVISMGSVAASGGYWVSLASDRILAASSTMTGSIGVFGIIPTYQRTLERFGVHTDGVGTTRMAGGMRLDRELHPDAARAFQLGVDRIYEQFIGLVSEARELDRAALDGVADGRIWTGRGALAQGLIDELGDFDQALEVAAKLAGLDEYDAVRIQPPLGFFESLLVELGEGFRLGAMSWLPAPLHSVAEQSLHPFLNLSDPEGVYAWCACDPR